ncbi:MAG: TOBE domain-containing protein, partial [Rhizobiaceae bacterium]|nr:TOBE domain-containing protein [Rhizobiaceae bacterium]
AGFIGSPGMNFINGRLSDSGPLEFIAEGGARLPVPESVAAARGRDLVYGIRPEHLIINQGGASATVTVIEPTGAETQITATLGSSPIVATIRDRLDLRAGDSFLLKPDLTKSHLFDAKTGKRISFD